MRFEKSKNYIELSQAMSVDARNSAVWFVDTNLSHLPVSLRKQVTVNDEDGFKALNDAVIKFVERNDYF